MASYRSARFGRFEINDGAALRFPDGVAGLSHLEWFAILKRRADSVFLWLQSLDDPDVALPIVLPWAFHWDYEIELPGRRPALARREQRRPALDLLPRRRRRRDALGHRRPGRAARDQRRDARRRASCATRAPATRAAIRSSATRRR